MDSFAIASILFFWQKQKKMPCH